MAYTNAPVTVNVRIEGLEETIFDDVIVTAGRLVTTTIGDQVTNFADGRNGNEYPFSVPTCTSALADVATGVNGRPTWGAQYFPSLDDFLITRINNEIAAGGQFWHLALNFSRTPLGGAQMRVQTGDSVLWALVNALQAPLKLKGPRSATANVAISVTVINGETQAAVAGAAVGGQITNAQGQAMITFPAAGPQTLRAIFAGFVRSNALRVNVVAAG